MPRVQGAADAGGESHYGVLLDGLPLRALAADAAGEGEDRDGEGGRDRRLPRMRQILDGWGQTSRLSGVLLSPLP